MTVYKFMPYKDNPGIYFTYDCEACEWRSFPDKGMRSFKGARVLSLCIRRLIEFRTLHMDGTPKHDPENRVNDENYYRMSNKRSEFLKKTGIAKRDWDKFIVIEDGFIKWIPEPVLIDKYDSEKPPEKTEVRPGPDMPLAPFSLELGGEVTRVRLQTQTSLAALDASILYQDPNDDSQNILLDNNLYVPRQEEETLATALTQDVDTNLFAIIGEAGTGKTSLLWHIHDRFKNRPDLEIWFLRPHVLELANSSGLFTTDDLLKAKRSAHHEGKTLLVLFDTVDLLLHDLNEADALLYLLQNLAEPTCKVVVSSRPQEANNLFALTSKIIHLDSYNPTELNQAIEKHAQFFYAKDPALNVATHVREVKQAVTQGEPVIDLCRRPLTLRMLFQLYAPGTIPPEIHIFQLYQDFWDLRVCMDGRMGSKIHEDTALRRDAERDCHPTASALAVAMLAEGVPDLNENQVKHACRIFGGYHTDLPILQYRGVIIKDQRGYRFFHQTFFEHSAAHGVLDLVGGQGLQMLQNRINERDFDFFVNPVLEHGLLLADQRAAPLRQVSHELLLARFQAGQPNQVSAAWVYAHLNRIGEGLRMGFHDVLTEGESPVIGKFLEAAVNTPRARARELFEDMAIVWKRDDWLLRARVLTLLKRLSLFHADRIVIFYERFQITRECWVKLPGDGNTILGQQFLPSLLFRLVAKKPQWLWSKLAELFEKSFDVTKSRKTQARIFEFLAQNAEAFKRNTPASDFSRLLVAMPDHNGRDFDLMIQAFGKLWLSEWQRRRLHARYIPACFSQHRVVHHGQLAGLALLCLEDPIDLEHLFDYYLHQQEPELQARWNRSFWPPLMPLLLEVDETSPPPSLEARDLRNISHRIRDLFQSTLHAEPALQLSPERTSEIAGQFAHSLVLADLPPRALAAWLDIPGFAAPKSWLGHEAMEMLLGRATLGGHTAARAALLELGKERSAAKLKKIMTDLCDLAKNDPDLTRQAFDIAIRCDDMVTCKKLIENTDNPDWIAPHARQLVQMTATNFHQSDQKKRYAAPAIWLLLLERGMGKPPTFDQIQTRARDSEPGIRAGVLQLVPFLLPQHPLDELLAFLKPFHRDQAEGVRLAALQARVSLLVRFLDRGGFLNQDVVSHTFDIVLAKERLETLMVYRLGYLIRAMAETHSEFALSLVCRLFSSKALLRVGKKGRKLIGHRYCIPIGSLAPHLDAGQQLRLLDLLKQKPEPDIEGLCENLAKPIVTKLFSLSHSEVMPHLAALQNDDSVHPETRKLIATYHFYHQRPKGSRAWPDLYQYKVAQREEGIPMPSFQWEARFPYDPRRIREPPTLPQLMRFTEFVNTGRHDGRWYVLRRDPSTGESATIFFPPG